MRWREIQIKNNENGRIAHAKKKRESGREKNGNELSNELSGDFNSMGRRFLAG